MNIALIGYGKMGKEVELISKLKQHHIKLIIQKDINILKQQFLIEKIDVAIDFSTPHAVNSNMLFCFQNNIPIVVGTTGWHHELNQITEQCNKYNGSLFYASNFSIGVNLFLKINNRVAEIINAYPNYHIQINETHHTQKLDAPSGTAISTANEIIKKHVSYQQWTQDELNTSDLLIKSKRNGNEIGYHQVIYQSDEDEIQIIHQAKSRKGFALGAVLAAEFLVKKKGIYTMTDLIK